MYLIGLIREGKIPPDNRVALTPKQCKWVEKNLSDVKVVVQPCINRCFSDKEYRAAGVELREDLHECDVLLGIKEVPVNSLLGEKKYMFFSHTKKEQPQNQQMMQAIIEKKITLIDFECLEHEDGQRMLGFGFFAGIVGAHNGMWAYGKRTGSYNLCRVGECRDYKHLIHTYFGLKLPAIKIAVTGSGRVASGVLEIMNLLDIIEVEPEEFLQKEFSYPVYVHLKGHNLYKHKITGQYNREDFHNRPANYDSKFKPFTYQTDILMNGTYWEKDIPPLFSWQDMLDEGFRIQTIADISDDKEGGVPCNMGNATIEFPVYGVDRTTREVIAPYEKKGVDIMAVGNLPNELPRDASSYFGDQFIKYILEELRKDKSPVIERAAIVKEGKLTDKYLFLKDYAEGKTVISE